MSEEPKAANVIEALTRVIRDLPAISKGQKMEEGPQRYTYRGIEQITSAVQPLLGKHGIVIVPQVLARTEEKFQVKSGAWWTDTYMEIRYTAYGPGGTNDYLAVGPFHAIGRDNSDKGTNKAMTQAYKQMLLQLLCVSDAKDDGDANRYEREEASKDGPVTSDMVSRFFKAAEAEGVSTEDVGNLVWQATMRTYELSEMLQSEWPKLRDAFKEHLTDRKREAEEAADLAVEAEHKSLLGAKAR